MRARSFVLAVVLAKLVGGASGAFGFCWEEAAQTSGLPVELLWAVVQVESGANPTAFGWNTNGTYDYGLGQINSSWAATLGPQRWQAVTTDACYNLKVAGWILRQCIDRHGWNWRGLGCYNASSDHKRAQYARRVIPILEDALARRMGDRPR